jgi:hypothetical protein
VSGGAIGLASTAGATWSDVPAASAMKKSSPGAAAAGWRIAPADAGAGGAASGTGSGSTTAQSSEMVSATSASGESD